MLVISDDESHGNAGVDEQVRSRHRCSVWRMARTRSSSTRLPVAPMTTPPFLLAEFIVGDGSDVDAGSVRGHLHLTREQPKMVT